MKLYVVQGNVYLESYGDYRNEKTRECKCYQTIIESIDDIDVTIVEVELNTPINKPIGGYAE